MQLTFIQKTKGLYICKVFIRFMRNELIINEEKYGDNWDFVGIVRQNALTQQKYVTIPYVLRDKFAKNKKFKIFMKEIEVKKNERINNK